MSAWWAEDVTAKARVVAHFMEGNLRDAYRGQKLKEAADKEARNPSGGPSRGAGEPPPVPEWAGFRQGGGGR